MKGIGMFRAVMDVAAGAMRNAAEERRKTLKILFYWDGIRGERLMPHEDDIDPDHQDIAELWPNCFMVQIRDLERQEYNYTYLGPALIDACRSGLSEAANPHIVSMNAHKLTELYRSIYEQRRPDIHEGEFTNAAGNLVKFRQVLLPLGRDKVEVIFGHMTHRIYS